MSKSEGYYSASLWGVWWVLLTSGRRGVLLGIVGGGVPPGSPNPDPISHQKCCFSHPFSELASKIHTHSQTWPLRSYVILLRSEQQRKRFLKTHFQFAYFSFFLSSFGIETVNKFLPARSSLENHTRFQTKMSKIYTRFQIKTGRKPYPLGQHIPICLIQGITPHGTTDNLGPVRGKIAKFNSG